MNVALKRWMKASMLDLAVLKCDVQMRLFVTRYWITICDDALEVHTFYMRRRKSLFKKESLLSSAKEGSLTR